MPCHSLGSLAAEHRESCRTRRPVERRIVVFCNGRVLEPPWFGSSVGRRRWSVLQPARFGGGIRRRRQGWCDSCGPAWPGVLCWCRGDAAAGVSWSQPGGGCFAASGEGVRLGAILVGRRGRGFCCSVASSAGAGATLRLGPIVPDATALPAAVCRGCPAAVAKAASGGTNSSVEQSPQPCSLIKLRPPTESAAALLLVWFVFGCSSPTNCASAKRIKL